MSVLLDWEFDDTLKMTYNNPVYIEQCKLRKVEIDETGFVEQIPLDKQEKLLVEEVDEDDDDVFDDEDDFDDDLFKKPSKSSLAKEAPKKPLNLLDDFEDEDDEANNSEITIKIGGNKSVAKKPTITPMAPPPMTDKESEELFGRKPTSSVRDRMKEELGDSEPDITLNVDKTSQNSSQSSKPKIKLNLKPKQ